MAAKEAKARIKINKLLDEAGFPASKALFDAFVQAYKSDTA